MVKIIDISFLFHSFFQDAFYNCDIFHTEWVLLTNISPIEDAIEEEEEDHFDVDEHLEAILKSRKGK